MNNYWKINITLYGYYHKYTICDVVRVRDRAEALTLAVEKRFGGKANITEHYLIDGEEIPAVFEFTDDGIDYYRYNLDEEITAGELHEAIQLVSEAEFMRLIGAPGLFGEARDDESR